MSNYWTVLCRRILSCSITNFAFRAVHSARAVSRCRALLTTPTHVPQPLCHHSSVTSSLTSSYRSLSTVPDGGEEVMNVFDRSAKQKQRNRSALRLDHQVYDYLKDEVGWRMADRISDVKRKFDMALDLGCGRGHIARHVLQDMVGVLYQSENAENILAQSDVSPEVPTVRVLADEESLPFTDNMFDLVISSMSLHWVNNLPSTFRQINRILKNDGCFMGAMCGGETLHELRVALQIAEAEREGGYAAHVSPFTSPQDLGALLNSCGFRMLTLDIDEIVINYPSMFEVMHDLQGMGENNCSWSRRPMLHRDTLTAAAAIYKEMFGNAEGVPAMFQILFFIGWKPDKSQMQPAKRGSGQISLKDIDKLDKVSKQLKDLKASAEETGTSSDSSAAHTIAELEKALEKARSAKAETNDGSSSKNSK